MSSPSFESLLPPQHGQHVGAAMTTRCQWAPKFPWLWAPNFPWQAGSLDGVISRCRDRLLLLLGDRVVLGRAAA
jgi:hypothetical protein